MVTQIITCYHCDSENVLKNAKAPNGKQKYLCRDCGRQSREEDPGSNAYAPQRREEILSAYQRSVPASEALPPYFGGFAQHRVTRWLKKAARLPSLERTPYCARRLRRGPRSSSRRTVLLRRKEGRQALGLDSPGAPHSPGARLRRHRRAGRARTCRRLWEGIPESYKGGVLLERFLGGLPGARPAGVP